ncbi:GspH/FimT family pseudopilin [Brumicola nitratireducens]|uniref:Type II secretion system protein H n=1 Tax=Glaciecola nitratireducens (strain JCM 12485 / KCTC 12276 / FR1064) TaxID=1085623 RepID=G4QDU7_GLANF|nr:GspH/FimT family pseudopilin [Glaciecola nitratireducens]AEP31126.1 putative type IV pilus biogenesis protein [Glaciecola nitratireducens FR1064]
MNRRQSRKKIKSLSKSKLKGTTLIELMVVIGILAIVGTLGVPSFLSIITKARITSETNQLNSLIRFTRFTAIDQQQTAVLCPADNYSQCSEDWNAPKIVFIDSNYNNEREPLEPLLMSMPKSTANNQIYSRNKTIKFYESGVTASPASLRICPASQEANYARLLTVSLQGKIKLSSDKNNDGIHENSAGKPLTCL